MTIDIETSLLAIMEKSELEKLIEEKIDSFHGYLTRNAAMSLVARERHLVKNEEKVVSISDITAGDKNITLIANISQILKPVTYTSGKTARKIMLKDSSGSIYLTLWNVDVKIANNLKIHDEVVIKGAYEKNHSLTLGYSGSISISKSAPFSDIKSLSEGEIVNIKGIVSAVKGLENERFIFTVSDSINSLPCAITQGVDRGQKLSEGSEVLIYGAIYRNEMLEVLEESRLLVRELKNIIRGILTDIRVVGNAAVFVIDGKETLLDRQNAFKALGVNTADDITLTTIVSLKKDYLINKSIHLKMI